MNALSFRAIWVVMGLLIAAGAACAGTASEVAASASEIECLLPAAAGDAGSNMVAFGMDLALDQAARAPGAGELVSFGANYALDQMARVSAVGNLACDLAP